MKAIVLAGGFAKRLWPLTKEQAKPLVDVGGRPIIEYVMDQLDQSEYVKEIIISTNSKFEENFKKWLSGQKYKKPIKIVIENSNHENEKLGAIGGLYHVLDSQKIDEDVLVVGGDNLLGIDLEKMIGEFMKKKVVVVAAFDIKSKDAVKEKFGEVIVDKSNKILELREKPKEPQSSLVSTCCYIFPKGIIKDIEKYLNEGGNKDAPGFLISWLAKKNGVVAYIFDSYWFDIGDHQTLERAREFAKTLS